MNTTKPGRGAGTTRRTAPRTAAKKKQSATGPKKAAPKKRTAAAKKPAAKKPAPRGDLGAPIDGFFAKQPPHLRPVLEALRSLVEEAAPEAASSLKWGMPFFTIAGETFCAIGAHAAHVNLMLPGPEGTYDDPEARLIGTGKTGRHLKLTKLEDLPRTAVRGWLRTAAARVRKK